MYAIMSDLGKYLVNRYALCLKGSNMPRPPLLYRICNNNVDIEFNEIGLIFPSKHVTCTLCASTGI